MKRIYPPGDSAKFSGGLRHYHRTAVQTQRSWNDWVEGTSASTRKSRNWLKIVGVVVTALALFGIIGGLIVELR